MKPFYITTPLYYVNDKPHLGTLYSTVLADVLKRWHELLGYESCFLTGTDEHGQKCWEAAKRKNIPVQKHCDEMAKQFEKTWKDFNISHNIFFRTTADPHKTAVQKCLQQLYDKKWIYSSEYTGWYSVSEETFYTKKDLVNGKSPAGKPVTPLKEKNYFFKMSAFQKKLIQHIENHPDFIKPDYRRNEVLGFLKKPLDDLCITRPKARLKWGVEVPFDKNYVTYVWVDALLNYVNAQGFYQKNKEEHFKKWWRDGSTLHIVGKDILITHAVYWPCLLMALDLPLPKRILAHGWLLNKSQEKMSKSQGSVMDPLELLKMFSAEELRYFLIRSIPIGNDTAVSHDLMKQKINEDLANNLGNLLRRCFVLVQKHFESCLPSSEPADVLPDDKKQLTHLEIKTLKETQQNILNLDPYSALQNIVDLLNAVNQYLEKTAPWKMVKTDKASAGAVLYDSLSSLSLCALLLKPVMPGKMKQVLTALNISDTKDFLKSVENFDKGEKQQNFPNLLKPGAVLKDLPVLFPRRS